MAKDKKIPDGPYKEFYEDGTLKLECVIKDGKKDGLYKKYYGNGKLELKGTYKNGKEEGAYQLYDYNGNVRREGFCENNKEIGPFKQYFENGNLESEAILKEGYKLEGPFKDYYENGNIKIVGSNKNDKQEGAYKRYDINGKLMREGTFKNGKREGSFQEYFPSGKLKLEGSFKNDKPKGSYKEYYEDGKLKAEGVFKDGEKVVRKRNPPNVEFGIKVNKKSSKAELWMDGNPLKTPKGNQIEHQNQKLIERIKTELETTGDLDVGILSLYSLLCSELDFYSKERKTFYKNQIACTLYGEITLRTCAGPEFGEQFECLQILEDYFKSIGFEKGDSGIYHPCLPQVDCPMISDWLESKNGQKLVDVITKEINSFSKSKRPVIELAGCNHKSFLLGFLLCKGLCRAEEYTNALLASKCILPSFSGVTAKMYKRAFSDTVKDAQIFLEYIKLTSI